MLNNEMNTLFAEGGMNQQGGTKDPVSGNDVPPGALQNEVRDDIPAKLSEGEFVIPADVVRYIGLERLMKLRDEAKAGLARMNEIGQMGNADQVENPEALHGDEFGQEIDDIMSEVDKEGGSNEGHFAAGGIVTVPSSDKDILAKYGINRTAITNPALDVRVLENAAGQKMYMTYFNGKPSGTIPAGYKESTTPYQAPVYTPTTTTKTTATDTTATGTTTDITGGGGPGNEGGGGPSVGTSTGAGGVGSPASIGNSAIGIAIGAIANAVTSPSVVSVPEDSLTVDAQGNTVSANAATAAANAAAAAASLANENSPMSENDSSAAAVSANDSAASANAASGVSGEGGVGGDGSAGAATSGDAGWAKGGLVTKRSKKSKK